MKAYPLTDSDLDNLNTLSTIAGVCLSLGSGFIGYSLDIFKDIDLSSGGTDASIIAFWKAIRIALLVVGIILLVASMYLLWRKGQKIKQIKDETVF